MNTDISERESERFSGGNTTMSIRTHDRDPFRVAAAARVLPGGRR